MNHVSQESDATAGEQQARAESRHVDGSKLTRYVRRAARSTTATGAVGGLSLLRGVRSFRRGKRVRGLAQVLVGGVLLAVVRRRSSSGRGTDVDQRDVVDTSPDIEDVASEGSSGERGHASGDEAAEVVDTAPDVEDAASETDSETVPHASGDEAADVVDTGPDIEDVDDEGTDEADADDASQSDE